MDAPSVIETMQRKRTALSSAGLGWYFMRGNIAEQIGYGKYFGCEIPSMQLLVETEFPRDMDSDYNNIINHLQEFTVVINEQAEQTKLDPALHLAVEATKKGRILFSGEWDCDEFNRGCAHIYSLLVDSHRLYNSGSFSTSTFLSITAIEETAKLEIAIYRREGQTAPAKRCEDALLNHKSKHIIAFQKVITIGSRLPKAIGEQRVNELLNMAATGELSNLREAALYMDTVNGSFICPGERISQSASREILLLALEVWHDRLVGYSEHTYELDKDLIQIFEEVSSSIIAPPC